MLSTLRATLSPSGTLSFDDVHVATALVGGADELITGENWNKPMLKVRELRVLSLQPRPMT